MSNVDCPEHRSLASNCGYDGAAGHVFVPTLGDSCRECRFLSQEFVNSCNNRKMINGNFGHRPRCNGGGIVVSNVRLCVCFFGEVVFVCASCVSVCK